MRRTIFVLPFLLLITLFVLQRSSAVAEDSSSLRVHENGRYLVDEKGKPFFWLGDTAWEMIHRLNRENTIDYLLKRKDQKFNVIQTVLLAEFDGLNTPNAYGHTPLLDRDPTRPDVQPGPSNDYWDHVDFVVDEAGKLGLRLALLPTWGEWVTPRFSKPAIFLTPEQGYAYGQFLGNRYRNKTNIIWVLGGDRPADEAPHGKSVWLAIAEGLADGRNGDSTQDGKADWSTTLMSYHSMTSCSKWFQQEPAIDFYMWGTYHSTKDWPRSFQIASKDYSLEPPKPTLNSEPPYEEHPRDYDATKGWFDDYEIRRAAWWSVMSGAMGHTYGAHPIWQFYDGKPVPPSKVPVPDVAKPRMTWKEALSLPVGNQMKHLRTLFESVDFATYRPSPDRFSLLEGKAKADSIEPNQLVGGYGKDFLLVYSPMGDKFTVSQSPERLVYKKLRPRWFDPRTGESQPIVESQLIEDAKGGPAFEFDPPGEVQVGNDWVLVIEH